jgi:hypothetical protein
MNQTASPDRYLRRTLSAKAPPFQRVQFLVRDYQNFEHDWEPGSGQSDQEDQVYNELRNEMRAYLDGLMGSRKAQDLQGTRDQISRCFANVDCFLLPHPGKSYPILLI